MNLEKVISEYVLAEMKINGLGDGTNVFVNKTNAMQAIRVMARINNEILSLCSYTTGEPVKMDMEIVKVTKVPEPIPTAPSIKDTVVDPFDIDLSADDEDIDRKLNLIRQDEINKQIMGTQPNLLNNLINEIVDSSRTLETPVLGEKVGAANVDSKWFHEGTGKNIRKRCSNIERKRNPALLRKRMTAQEIYQEFDRVFGMEDTLPNESEAVKAINGLSSGIYSKQARKWPNYRTFLDRYADWLKAKAEKAVVTTV